jgi:hypothetical protein
MGQLDDRYVDARSYVKSQQHEDNADIGFPAFDKHLFEDAVVFFTGKPVYTHAGREADAARYTHNECTITLVQSDLAYVY